MELRDFLLRDQVIETFLATLVAFGLTQFIGSLEKNIFRPFVRQNVPQHKFANALSGLLGLVVILVIVYLSYRYVAKRSMNQQPTTMTTTSATIAAKT